MATVGYPPSRSLSLSPSFEVAFLCLITRQTWPSLVVFYILMWLGVNFCD